MKKGICIAFIAALGTAAILTYSSMDPKSKRQLKRDIKNTTQHMEDVKDDLIDAHEDVVGIAKNISQSIQS